MMPFCGVPAANLKGIVIASVIAAILSHSFRKSIAEAVCSQVLWLIVVSTVVGLAGSLNLCASNGTLVSPLVEAGERKERRINGERSQVYVSAGRRD